MTLLQIVVLALIQGATEFLPVSSAAHLAILLPVTQWPGQGLDMDLAIQAGTLGAVLIYFWRDVFGLILGFLRSLRGRFDAQARLFWFIVLATLPLFAAGLAIEELGGTSTVSSFHVIAWTTLGYGLLFGLTDRLCMTVKRIEHLGIVDVLALGLAQILALVPGTSRMGIALIAARALGYERAEAARLSMLLSIPVLLGSGLATLYELAGREAIQLTNTAMITTAITFVTALFSIAFLMNWLRRSSFRPFVVYRVLLGTLLLGLLYTGHF